MPNPVQAEEKLEQCARAIASGLGYDWDTLYAGKAEWTADHGARHDINVPYKPDFVDAASAVLQALLQPSPAMVEAGCNTIWGDGFMQEIAGVGEARVDAIRRAFPAMIQAALDQKGEGE